MKAVLLETHGPPDVLSYKDIDTPECTPDKIKIKVKNSSINHLDLWIRSGIPGIEVTLPMVLGSDAAGIIEEIGSNVTGYNIPTWKIYIGPPVTNIKLINLAGIVVADLIEG